MRTHTAALALAVRVVQALAIRTAFAPDEFWQSIEVAHRIVFGYGHLTWEWAVGLRSYAHPLLFAAPYAVLKALSLDTVWAVIRIPLLLQAVAAATTDLYVAQLAGLVLGRQAARWCLVCQLASWFNAYCLIRTYSNSLEALLAAAGAYHWLLCCRSSSRSSSRHSSKSCLGADGVQERQKQRRQLRGHAAGPPRTHQRAWLFCAGLSVVFRPASALFWLLPAALQLWEQSGNSCWALLLDACALGGSVLGGAALIDRIGYGRWVAVPWEFFKFNFLAGASAQYGAHPWHWNLSQGLPAVAASLLPLLAAGLLLCVGAAGDDMRDDSSSSSSSMRLLPAMLAAWSVATYSLPSHKEFRFLLPALQLLMPYCGLAAACTFSSPAASRAASSPSTAATGRQQAALQRPRTLWRWGAAGCILVQLPMAAYFLLLHQRAQVGVMGLIRGEAVQHPSTSVLFLTPCHSTPYYSHVHIPVPMRFLDCSPHDHAAATAALNMQHADAWLRLPQPEACGAAPGAQLSQRQCFERDPQAYLEAVWEANPGQHRPGLLVGFAPLMAQLAPALQRWGYRLHTSMPNCWLQTDDDSACELHLWSLV